MENKNLEQAIEEDTEQILRGLNFTSYGSNSSVTILVFPFGRTLLLGQFTSDYRSIVARLISSINFLQSKVSLIDVSFNKNRQYYFLNRPYLNF
jgi:hypothetical protein